jgi:hypothetical protein
MRGGPSLEAIVSCTTPVGPDELAGVVMPGSLEPGTGQVRDSLRPLAQT